MDDKQIIEPMFAVGKQFQHAGKDLAVVALLNATTPFCEESISKKDFPRKPPAVLVVPKSFSYE